MLMPAREVSTPMASSMDLRTVRGFMLAPRFRMRMAALGYHCRKCCMNHFASAGSGS